MNRFCRFSKRFETSPKAARLLDIIPINYSSVSVFNINLKFIEDNSCLLLAASDLYLDSNIPFPTPYIPKFLRFIASMTPRTLSFTRSVIWRSV